MTTVFQFLAATGGHAQRTPCGTPDLTPADVVIMGEAMANKGGPEAPLTWDIPVRVTVCMREDAASYGGTTIDAAYIDDFLDDMNGNINTPPSGNTFHFFRCGPVNFIYESDLYFGQKNVQAYSYVPNFLNLYVYNKNGANPYASFPWHTPNNIVHLTQGALNLADGTGFHELGHIVGLLHTFNPGFVYTVPVIPNQQDDPTQANGRELVIRVDDPTKIFSEYNWDTAGDWVGDTPPGCDDGSTGEFFPSSATIAGCLDQDPNTPCINGCYDFNPNTPCEVGCAYNYTTCTYSGTYRDYNFDLVADSANVLARNYMSYTGLCRQEFTAGQKERADQTFHFLQANYYEDNLCNSLIDKVEIEASDVGLYRVALRIRPTNDTLNESRAVTDTLGQFAGKLPTTSTNVEVGAYLTKWGSGPNFSFTYADWMYGVSTFDLVLMSRHILGIDTLNGYSIIAADINNSHSVTTFDIIELRKLILGIYAALPNNAQPWRFIPEFVTLQPVTNVLSLEFDGIDFDQPFGAMYIPPVSIPAGAPYLDAGWPFIMRSGTGRNGFDAVKAGNVGGGFPAAEAPTDECPGEVELIVPNAEIVEDEEVELQIRAYDFDAVAAFQLGFYLSGADFEYLGASSAELSEFSGEYSVVGADLEEDAFKVVWLRDDLAPETLQDGQTLFSLHLKARQNIPNLQDAIALQDEVLENFFLSADSDCKASVSLEVNLSGSHEREGGQEAQARALTRPILCMPNPARDFVKIALDAERDFEGVLLFHDAQGRLVKSVSHRFLSGRNILSQDISALPSGLLNLSVQAEHGRHFTRIAKY